LREGIRKEMYDDDYVRKTKDKISACEEASRRSRRV